MTNEVKHCFSLDRCEMIINLYHNIEDLRMKIAAQCDNTCLGLLDNVKKDIYDLTIPELNEYPLIVKLRKNKPTTKKTCNA